MANEHWCSIHQQPFFKKGNMKGYAHPIKNEAGDTTGWCNEDARELKEKLDSGEIKPTKPVSPPLQQGEEPMEEKMTKSDWEERNKATRKSIERQKALDCAVNFAVAKIQAGQDIKADAVEKVAVIFENYIEFGVK